ncbi:hypothetical protein BGX24_007254 [Mortierella sp. AD032]|nr:hypothetical protein BGX24_007254 [Mortierella sp. AD032]
MQPKFAFKETSLTHWRPASYRPPVEDDDIGQEDPKNHILPPASAPPTQKATVFSTLSGSHPSESASTLANRINNASTERRIERRALTDGGQHYFDHQQQLAALDLDDEPEVTRFLVERARENPAYSSQLQLVVFKSEQDDTVSARAIINAKRILGHKVSSPAVEESSDAQAAFLARMTNPLQYKGPPSGVEMTSEGRSTFNKLKTSAKKALFPTNKADTSLSNAVAAIHVENSRIINRFGRFAKDEPALDDSKETKAPTPVIAMATTPDPFQAASPQPRRSRAASTQSSSPRTLNNPSASVPAHFQPEPLQPRRSRAASTQWSSPRTFTNPSVSAKVINFFSSSKPTVRQSVVEQPNKAIFSQNIAKPFFRAPLPKLGHRFNSTLQLAFGLQLLPQRSLSSQSTPKSLVSVKDAAHELDLSEEEEAWRTAVGKDPFEQSRLCWLAAQVVAEFLKSAHNDVQSIREILLLGPIFDRKDYRSILSSLIGQLEQETLLDMDLLRGLIQLLRDASPRYLIDDDLVRILRILRQRLKDTYKALGDTEQPASEHTYILATAISRVLDAMIEGNVKNLNRTEDHQPLFDILAELKDSSESILKFQAAYAWQALQFVGDDESPLHAVLRFAGGLTKIALGVASGFKFDPDNLCNGLYELGLATGQAYDVVKASMEGYQAFRAGSHGAMESLVMGFQSGTKRLWYPALQGARVFIREGRLADFERVVSEAPCRHESEFQWGVCQLLGELAMDTIWETRVRKLAVDLLAKLYKSDGTWSPGTHVKSAIFGIALRICKDADQNIQHHAAIVFMDMTDDSVNRPFPLITRLPPPTSSPTLENVLKIPSIEHDLYRLKTLRLMEYEHSIYIPPFAKASPSASDDDSFPLMTKVKEFLEGNQQVFLIIGDSGSGKSTFSRRLEYLLLRAYFPGRPIPLYINLPTLQNPEKELIPEQLKMYDVSDSTIQELKCDRQLILICDGYDEARLVAKPNLHSTNCFNRPGQWNTKMIISCRSTHVGREYHSQFQPQPTNSYGRSLRHLFQEATIVPFSGTQIKEYVVQFVQETEVHELFGGGPVWSAQEYLDNMKVIPNLMKLAKNPFLLTLTMATLPEVTKETGLSKTDMTRWKLFKAFVNKWLECNKERLLSMKLGGKAAEVLDELVQGGFREIALRFLQDLAGAMYQHQRGEPVVEYVHRWDKDTWKAQFFGTGLDITLLRESSPLTRESNLHSFLHRSLLEYFYSCHMSKGTEDSPKLHCTDGLGIAGGPSRMINYERITQSTCSTGEIASRPNAPSLSYCPPPSSSQHEQQYDYYRDYKYNLEQQQQQQQQQPELPLHAHPHLYAPQQQPFQHQQYQPPQQQHFQSQQYQQCQPSHHFQYQPAYPQPLPSYSQPTIFYPQHYQHQQHATYQTSVYAGHTTSSPNNVTPITIEGRTNDVSPPVPEVHPLPVLPTDLPSDDKASHPKLGESSLPSVESTLSNILAHEDSDDESDSPYGDQMFFSDGETDSSGPEDKGSDLELDQPIDPEHDKTFFPELEESPGPENEEVWEISTGTLPQRPRHLLRIPLLNFTHPSTPDSSTTERLSRADIHSRNHQYSQRRYDMPRERHNRTVLNTLSLEDEPDIAQLLVERAKEYPVYASELRDIVSKRPWDPAYRNACANAQEILKRAGLDLKQ